MRLAAYNTQAVNRDPMNGMGIYGVRRHFQCAWDVCVRMDPIKYVWGWEICQILSCSWVFGWHVYARVFQRLEASWHGFARVGQFFYGEWNLQQLVWNVLHVIWLLCISRRGGAAQLQVGAPASRLSEHQAHADIRISEHKEDECPFFKQT